MIKTKTKHTIKHHKMPKNGPNDMKFGHFSHIALLFISSKDKLTKNG